MLVTDLTACTHHLFVVSCLLRTAMSSALMVCGFAMQWLSSWRCSWGRTTSCHTACGTRSRSCTRSRRAVAPLSHKMGLGMDLLAYICLSCHVTAWA
jgi:hypothetical protein